MQSAQASEPGGDTILTTVPNFNTEQFSHTESEPTVVREQNPPFSGPVHNNSQSFTNIHHKKPRPDNVLMALSEEDREQLNEWLLSNSYTQVLELLARPRSEGGLGVRSHRASLWRYYDRVMHSWIAERRQRSLHLAKHFHDAETGQFDIPTIEAVKQRAFETVLNPQADPGLLKALLRTVLKLQDQQLAREKLDLATAKTIQAERIVQIESAGCNPYRTSVTEIDTILKERAALRNASKPTAKPIVPVGACMAEASHPLSPIISAVTDEGPIPLLDPLTIERQKLLAVLKAKLRLDAQTARTNPNSAPSTALDDLQDSLDDILAARSNQIPPTESAPSTELTPGAVLERNFRMAEEVLEQDEAESAGNIRSDLGGVRQRSHAPKDPCSIPEINLENRFSPAPDPIAQPLQPAQNHPIAIEEILR